MRKLALDFDLIVLWPSIVFVLIVLWNSIRTLRLPLNPHWSEEPWGKDGEPLKDLELDNCRQERREERQQAKHLAKFFLWLSGAALLVLCAVMLMSDRWKLDAASLVWRGLGYLSLFTFIIAIPVTWDYAKKQDRLKLAACFTVMLMAAASFEHFIHQEINTRHIVCPRCTNGDDGRPDDN